MKQILDLHIHSRYSRSCSPRLTLENIDQTCRIKGVDIIGTGDFTYPDWFKSINNELEEIRSTNSGLGFGTGLYKLKKAPDEKIKFLLSSEVALIYKDGGRCRRIHIVLHAPDLNSVKELNKILDMDFNIRSDGRPILGMSAPDLMKICFSINPSFIIYPAHIWTPWFSVFGSKSGFDNMEECFHDQTKNIFAIETGLSSDPEMNWRLKALDKYTILSNSDAHSLENIAREASVMNLNKPSYQAIFDVIKNKKISSDSTDGMMHTIEFYPEEGMYHYDGHRACGIRFTPEETKKHKCICPVCGKLLTVGVSYRVDELADRPLGIKPKEAAPFKKLVELDKIICEALNVGGRKTQKVKNKYDDLIKKGESELEILIDKPIEELRNEITSSRIVEGIRRVRAGELKIEPGFDGQYGKIKIFLENEKEKQEKLL